MHARISSLNISLTCSIKRVQDTRGVNTLPDDKTLRLYDVKEKFAKITIGKLIGNIWRFHI